MREATMGFNGGLVFLIGFATVGCNVIFDIQPADGTAGGATTSTSSGGTGGGTTPGGAGGIGGTGGAGGSGGGCLPLRPAVCEEGTLSDPENCCIKGRSCQGGECKDGTCTPVVIAAYEDPANEDMLDVVVAGDSVFWSSGGGGKVYRVSIDGGEVFEHTTSTDTPSNVARLATDSEYIYFSNYFTTRISRVPIEGGNPQIVTEVAGGSDGAGLGNLVVAQNKVFFRLEQAGGLYYAPLDNLPATATLLETTKARGVSADETHVYFATGTNAEKLVRLPLDDLGGNPQTVYSGVAPIVEIGVFQDRVYFATFGSSPFVSALKDGNNSLVISLANNVLFVPDMVSDGNDVFFTLAGCQMNGNCGTPSKGGLFRTSVAGGPKVELATTTEFGDMYGVTMDCDTVYFTSPTDHQLLKLTR